MALLDSSTRGSESALDPAPPEQVLSAVSRPAATAASLWERFKGAFWTLLDQGAISLGSFLVNIGLARHLDAPEYGTFALLLGSFFLVQHFNAAFLYYPLMVKLGGGQQERPSDLVFEALVLTTLSTVVLLSLVTSCLIVFDRSDVAIAAGVYLLLWQLQDVLRRALLAQFSHRMAAIADATAYIGAAAGVGILALYDSLTLSNALFAMAGACALAIVVQVIQRPPTFPRSGTMDDLLQGFWAHGTWAFVNGILLIVTVQAFPWALAIIDGPASAASFQAILNVANLANPIALGLSNIITPAVAQAYASGSMRSAWAAAHTYIVIGAALLSCFVTAVILVPNTVLTLFYGVDSPYRHLEETVIAMVLAVAINSIVDMMSQFIFAVGSPRVAVWMNGLSLAVAVLLLPFVGWGGVVACALALGAAKVVRLAAGSWIIARMLSSEERALSGPNQTIDAGRVQ